MLILSHFKINLKILTRVLRNVHTTIDKQRHIRVIPHSLATNRSNYKKPEYLLLKFRKIEPKLRLNHYFFARDLEIHCFCFN